MFALVVIIIGALLSWLIPKIPPAAETHPLQGVEGFEPALPLDPDPELIEGDEAPAPRARAGVIPH